MVRRYLSTTSSSNGSCEGNGAEGVLAEANGASAGQLSISVDEGNEDMGTVARTMTVVTAAVGMGAYYKKRQGYVRCA